METRLIFRQPVLRNTAEGVDRVLEEGLEKWDSMRRSEVIHRILHAIGQVDGLSPTNMQRVVRCGLPEDCYYVLDKGLPSEIMLGHCSARILHQDGQEILEVAFTSDYLQDAG